jgi:hypothetical protein
MANARIEKDSLHNVEWRPFARPPHAHNTIRHAEQIETAEEIDVPLPRSLPEARRARKATTRMDIGLVGETYTDFFE